METSSGSVVEKKPASSMQRWLPGFPIALCLLMSISSITVCLLMSFKTFQLENRLQMQIMETASIFQPLRRSFQNEDGSLVSDLAAPIEALVEEVHVTFYLFDSGKQLIQKTKVSEICSPARNPCVNRCHARFWSAFLFGPFQFFSPSFFQKTIEGSSAIFFSYFKMY